MFEALEQGIGLEIVLWFQERRIDFLDTFVELLDFLGEDLVYIALMLVIYFALSKKLAPRVYFAIVVSGILTFVLKELFGRLRPYAASEAVQPLFEDVSYGFPSGHTMMTIVIWGYIAYWVRKTWVTVVLVIYMLTQAVGRVYAGVHFPQDIVGGIVFGAIALAIYIPATDRIAAWWQDAQMSLKLAIVAVIVMPITVIFVNNENTVSLFALALGGAVGFAIEQRYIRFSIYPQGIRRAVQVVLSLVLTVLVLEGLDVLFGEQEALWLSASLRFVRYIIVAIVGISGTAWLGVRVGLLNSEDDKNAAPSGDVAQAT